MVAEMFAHTCGKGDLFMSNIQTKYARFVDEHCEAHDICMVTLCAGEFAEDSLTINGVLAEKRHLELPDRIVNVLKCKNPRCITTVEQGIDHIFRLTDREHQVYRCTYCESKAK